MSRVELSAIQTKLKAAIQSHQMLVVKMKGDNQNPSLKKGLTELQEEIKKLSEEQKKIVVRVRENLVKASTQAQPQQPVAPIASLGQTITAIGQPRLVSFPTQGGATILPVGMVAVPIAHVQRPALGMTMHPVSSGPMSQATSISLIPTGIISSGGTISLNPMNSGGTISLNPMNSGGTISLNPMSSGGTISLNPMSSGGTINLNPMSSGGTISLNPMNSGGTISLNPMNSGATISLGNSMGGILHGNIAISNLGSTNLISTTTSGVSSNSTLGIIDDPTQNNSNSITCNLASSSSAANSCIPSSGTALSNLSNMTNLYIGTSITNGHHNNTNHILTNNNMGGNSCLSTAPITSSLLPVASMNAITVSSAAPGIVISPFPQQPLVQPQLLQQQQQQILQMIQQQQHHQPPQRLASHVPIKVPHYTASVVRPVITSSISTQFCNIAPAPSTVTTTSSVRVASSSSAMSQPQAGKPLPNKEATVLKEQQPTAKQDQAKPQQQHQVQQHKQHHKQLEIPQEQQRPEQMPVPVLSQEELEKLSYMKALDLYTIDALKEVMNRRSERKRRTTANPNYSFGFELSRKDRNASLWAISSKKQKTRGKGAVASSKGNGWTDSTSFQQHKSSNKTNDNHDDYCAACGKGGQLLMCETCRLVYHLDCLNPPLTEAPKYAWSCPKCLISGKGFVHLNSEAVAKVNAYIAKKSAKEDERKKTTRKGKELHIEKNFLDNRSKELDVKMKEQNELQSKLSAEERKVKDELSKLSDFVRTMRESRTTDHLSAPKAGST